MIAMAAIAVLAQAACTMFIGTDAVPRWKATAVPKDRLLAFTDNKPGSVSVIVTRDTGFMGGGCFIGLVIEGTLAARFDTSETAVFYLPPGEANMAAIPDPKGRGSCGVSGWDPVLETYDMKADRPNLYRISLRAYRRPDVVPSVY